MALLFISSAKNYPKMKIVHTHHGITGSKDYPSPNISVSSPRLIGISRPMLVTYLLFLE
ncbi:MAG TPA: hypothetical protein VFY41_03145 [Nitrososphaeraceae archaeon]|nr:hypothetical protein [Nitrososphaeraceae archaeon]